MELTFERGTSGEPRGHALLYFRSERERREVFACYLVVPPVPLNLSRYMPPLLSGSLPPSQLQQVSAVPLPPMPEKVDSYQYLQQLADLRDDDLIFGGALNPDDAQQGLMLAGEGAQRYFSLYADFMSRAAPPADAEEPEAEEAGGVSDVIYGLMSERQRLGELAKLTGQLRYAVEGSDVRLVKETVREMEALAGHVPDKYRVRELIAAGQITGPRGQRLSELYVDRCYRLADEDYASMAKIEEEIRVLQSPGDE